MGTDIHFYTEVKDGDKWVTANKWTDKYNDGELYADEMYDGRNYSLFGMLADVRNGSGFAGCDLGDGFIPIAEPRGIPGDASAEVKAEWERGGDHTPTHLTLSELLKYNWCMTTKQRGTLSIEEYIKYIYSWKYRHDEDKCPDSYSGGCSGGNVVHMDREKIDNIISAIDVKDIRHHEKADHVIKEIQKGLPKGKSIYLRIEWEAPYYLAAGDFLNRTLPKLLTLSKSPTFDDVRVVFWFDN